MIAITGRDNNGDDGTTTWFVVDGEVYGVCVGNAKHPAARLLDSDGAPEDFRGQFSAVSAVAFEAMVALCSVAETLDVDAIKSAVERSISHTESAEVAVPSWEAALPALKSVAGELELDWCELEPGRYDVWAFDATGPEGGMAWRLTVVADDGGAP